MPLLADAIRPFWIRDLHTICGRPASAVGQWIQRGRGWQIASQPTSSSFTLDAFEYPLVLEAFAADSSRMATAAFESVSGIQQETRARRSTAWMVIRSYYSAYFAAHAIMRFTGATCTQLTNGAVGTVERLVTSYGFSSVSIQDGYYECRLDSSSGRLTAAKLIGNTGGSHGAFWNAFRLHLTDVANRILASNILPQEEQQASTKLSEVVKAIEVGTGTSTSGVFLSSMRNNVNYRHSHGCWFPYANASLSPAELARAIGQWRTDPMTIKSRDFGADELQRFACCCAFLVALCREVCTDMYSRCPDGKSFHHFTTHSLLSMLKLVGPN